MGPVRQSDELTIEAQLDGFSFTKKAGSVVDFASVKLSKLTVAVVWFCFQQKVLTNCVEELLSLNLYI